MNCSACKGPFHEATGHIENERRRYCGACYRGLLDLLREYRHRRWGGVRFYDHAFVPTGDTSAADLALEEET